MECFGEIKYVEQIEIKEVKIEKDEKKKEGQ